MTSNRAGPSSLIVASLFLLEACHSSSDDGGAVPPPAPPPPGATVGFDARPSNLTCVAPPKTAAGAAVQVQRVFPNLPLFNQPLAMVQAPGDDTRWFVVQKGGTVRVFQNTPNVATASNFISVSVNANSEGGLLGMAFHPDWATNRFVYLSFTEGSPMVSTVARFTSNDGGFTLTPGTRANIIRVPQPAGLDNHKGGNIAFGPDGLL